MDSDTIFCFSSNYQKYIELKLYMIYISISIGIYKIWPLSLDSVLESGPSMTTTQPLLM